MPDPSVAWPRVAATTLADQVYHAVRAKILAGQVAPGQFIRETDLNEAMGASRTPIREALNRLASEGFLERIPRRGFRAPEEPVGDLLHLYPVVASLDLLAGRLALSRFRPEDLVELKRINARLREAKDRDDIPALIRLNNEFHHLFSVRSGNPRLCSLLDDLRAQLNRLELWYYSDGEHTQRSIQEHDAIIAALEDGDYERALALLETNMALTYDALVAEADLEQQA